MAKGATIDPDALLAAGGPSDDEVAAAARSEAKGTGDSVPTAPKRGPGRPPGSRTRSTSSARAAGAATKPTVEVPSRPLTGAAKSAADKAAAARHEESTAERNFRVALYTEFMSSHRVDVVKGVSMVLAVPADVVIGAEADPADPTMPLIGQNGLPVLTLTQAGAMLAPTDGQIKIVANAGARLTETEQGRKLLELIERLAPYGYAAAAVGALGMYAVGTFQAANMIKAQLAAQALDNDQAGEQQQAAAAAAAQGAGAPLTPDLGVPAESVA